MLVLTRKIGESLVIDNNIIVNVDSLRNKQVRLAISTPHGVIIQREEAIAN